MLDYSESPPPLHHSPATSDKSLFPSRDSTPVTPVGFTSSRAKRPEKDKELYIPWFRKPIDIGITTTSLCPDSTLLEPDFDDLSFPLFGSPREHRSMAGPAAPIAIATRQASTSPRGPQPSNLTSGLQRTNNDEKGINTALSAEGTYNGDSGQSVAMSDGFSMFEKGAKPISMSAAAGDKTRRESLAQSLTGGMSLGGISVGSWIRDDIMMSGTSSFPICQSPSYHSSSYLPRLEANFMRDFSCCSITLPSLHDLLQHYEEAHAQKSSQASRGLGNEEPAMPDSRAAIATNTAAAVQQQAQQQQQQQSTSKPIAPAQRLPQSQLAPQEPQRSTGFSSTLQTIPDMDTVEDMEMDDIPEAETTPSSNLYTQQSIHQSPRSELIRSAQPRVPQLKMNMMHGHQGFGNSTPTTPITQGRLSLPLQNNPTVSSVNTPTLMANPMQQQFQDVQGQYRGTPDSSTPGTPPEFDDSIVESMGDMSMQNNLMFAGNQNQNYGLNAFGMNNDMLDLCIDEPAKRLFSPTGVFGNQSQQYAHMRLGSGQYGPNSDIARRIREQQMLAGVPDTTAGMMPHDEPKPFRCPVIGCEKAYKNQNGLKYHKSHGHNNQRLHDNADGTFSIVNPETSAPYPGTLGMEKEKPYKCDVCGKRYKNLNGLKYHKTHSAPCNSEIQISAGRDPGTEIARIISNQNLAVPATGIPTDAGLI